MEYGLIQLPARSLICRHSSSKIISTMRLYFLDSGIITLSDWELSGIRIIEETGKVPTKVALPNTWNGTVRTSVQHVAGMEADILMRSLEVLFSLTDSLRTKYDGATSLNYNEMPLYQGYKATFVRAYADATGLTIDQAKTQLEFDYDELSEVIYKTKYIEVKYTNLLFAAVKNNDIESWRRQFQEEFNGLGSI